MIEFTQTPTSPLPPAEVAAERDDDDAPAPPREERVSVMFGDRLCTSCHYNLLGQPVLREPHYGMLIVRCPECATVASVQEYPALGRWANRWTVILSALWLAVIFGVSFGAFPAMIASSVAFTEENVDDYEDTLQEDWLLWYEAEFGQAPTNVSWWNPEKFDEWRDAGRPAAVLEQTGGFWSAVRGPELFFYLIPTGIAFTYGCFICVALVHRRRRTLVSLAVALLVIAALIYGTAWYQISKFEVISSFSDVAMFQVFLPLLAVAFGLVWTAMLLGALVGRKIARGLVRLLLPPRMRAAAAVLWTTDGLRPPGMRTLRA